MKCNVFLGSVDVLFNKENHIRFNILFYLDNEDKTKS